MAAGDFLTVFRANVACEFEPRTGIRARDELRHTPGHFVDIAPTVLDLAGSTILSALAASRAVA